MLKPMNDTIFGEIISDDSFDDLTRLFQEVSETFRETFENRMLDGQVAVEERKIAAQLQKKNKLHYMVTVTATGPDCRELAIGDTAILPPYGGTMVTVVDEETNLPMRVFAISESKVLARWRED